LATNAAAFWAIDPVALSAEAGDAVVAVPKAAFAVEATSVAAEVVAELPDADARGGTDAGELLGADRGGMTVTSGAFGISASYA
jgi:hypothetical protein